MVNFIKNIVKEKKGLWLPLLTVVFSLTFYFYFGFMHLGQFHTADEHYWVSDPDCGRIFQYWNAMANGFWSKTMINDKPGISLAYVASPALFFNKNINDILNSTVACTVGGPEKVIKTALRFRIPILFFNGIFCFYFFWILKRLLKNNWLAAWGASLILLSPILLGISQIVNPDSLLWVFVAASILSFLTYLKSEEKKFIWLTAFFTGWALLSKYTAVILFIYYLLAIFIHYVFNAPDLKEILAQKVKKHFLAYLAIIIFSGLLFILLIPAIYLGQNNLKEDGMVGLKGFYAIIIFIIFLLGSFLSDAYFLKSKILNAIIQFLFKYKKYFVKFLYLLFILTVGIIFFYWMGSYPGIPPDIMKIPFDNGKGYLFNSQNIVYKAILELVPLIFSLQPFVLFSLLFLLAKSILKKTDFEEIIFSLFSFFCLFYLAVISQNLLVEIRYSIILYPLVMILAAIGIFEMTKKRVLLGKLKNLFLSLLILILCIASLWMTKPFYFNYNNMLLPNSRVVADAWGYGGYEAAQYLNSLPGSKQLVVWSDYNGFCQFFVGTCVKGDRDLKNRNRKKEEKPIDYLVKTRRGSILYKEIWEKWESSGSFQKENPVWFLYINNRPDNYVKIYKPNNNFDDNI